MQNYYITNNLSESFNVWILKARYWPCVDLIDKIRVKMMEKMSQRRRIASSWKGKLVPMADRYVTQISKHVGGWIVTRSDEVNAETEYLDMREVLDLQQKTCTCRRWQLTGLLCRDAAEVIPTIRRADWSQYKLAYQASIGTLGAKAGSEKPVLGY
ncbi:hypothetical protein Droror1_Dr00007863 [Drosera rotundifolia]